MTSALGFSPLGCNLDDLKCLYHYLLVRNLHSQSLIFLRTKCLLTYWELMSTLKPNHLRGRERLSGLVFTRNRSSRSAIVLRTRLHQLLKHRHPFPFQSSQAPHKEKNQASKEITARKLRLIPSQPVSLRSARTSSPRVIFTRHRPFAQINASVRRSRDIPSANMARTHDSSLSIVCPDGGGMAALAG